MRIDGPGPLGGVRSGSAKPAAGSGARFTLPGGEERTAETSGSRAAASVAGLDAMLALQGVDDPPARRRRALRRGHRMLDVLDRLKLGLLEGAVQPADVARLNALAREPGEPAGDPLLDALLGEIDLRTQVEAAKLERARQEREARNGAATAQDPGRVPMA